MCADNEVTFLGFKIDGVGIHPCPKKVIEIRDKPAQRDINLLTPGLHLKVHPMKKILVQYLEIFVTGNDRV